MSPVEAASARSGSASSPVSSVGCACDCDCGWALGCGSSPGRRPKALDMDANDSADRCGSEPKGSLPKASAPPNESDLSGAPNEFEAGELLGIAGGLRGAEGLTGRERVRRGGRRRRGGARRQRGRVRLLVAQPVGGVGPLLLRALPCPARPGTRGLLRRGRARRLREVLRLGPEALRLGSVVARLGTEVARLRAEATGLRAEARRPGLVRLGLGRRLGGERVPVERVGFGRFGIARRLAQRESRGRGPADGGLLTGRPVQGRLLAAGAVQVRGAPRCGRHLGHGRGRGHEAPLPRLGRGRHRVRERVGLRHRREGVILLLRVTGRGSGCARFRCRVGRNCRHALCDLGDEPAGR